MKTLSTRSLLIPNYKQESCLSDLITQKLNHRNPISLFPPSLNHTEKLRSTSLFLAYFSFNFVQNKKKKKANREQTHLDQGHLRAEGQQDLLGLGGVGVVSVLVEPLLERPRHVLQGLALVSHFAAAGTTPVEEHVDREPDTKPKTCYQIARRCTHETFI